MNNPLKPEAAISSWQQWSGDLPVKPEVIGHLTAGQSNRSYLLKSGNQKLVLRLNDSDTLLPGSDRNNEMKVWQAASTAGLAPPLLYANEQQGLLVSTYIEDHLPAQPEGSNVIISRAFALLKGCHQLKTDTPGLNLNEHIQKYWRLIEASSKAPDPDLLKQRQAMQDLLDSPLFKHAKTGFCHHDPNISNFVGGPDRLYLLDWEYAANGLLVMDYAALAVEWNLTDKTVLTRSGVNPELLTMAKKLYTYLCQLWQQATP